MADPYVAPAISGFNANPPTDDGASTALNTVEWAKHKEKLADPIKSYADAINAAIGNGFNKVVGGAGVTSTGVNYTVLSSDQGKLVRATAAGITVTTPDATSVLSPFVFCVINNSGGAAITLDGNGSQTINGSVSLSLADQNGVILYTDGSNWFAIGLLPTVTLARGHLAGLQLSNNGTDSDHDIDFADGTCRDSANAADITLASVMTKQIDASWVAGTDNGGLSSSLTVSNNTWYHAHAMLVGGVADIGFDTSLTAANLVSDHSATAYRRIGSVLTDGSANILAFEQVGDRFLWANPIADVNVSDLDDSATLYTISTPLGLKVDATIRARVDPSGSGPQSFTLISSPDANDELPAGTGNPLPNVGGGVGSGAGLFFNELTVRTDTSSRIRARADAASTELDIDTVGWIDRRGRDD